MFKRFLFVFFFAFLAIGLIACDGEEVERTFAADGEFMAFEWKLNYGAPQVSSVTVTIKNDKIVSYFIDAIQSQKVEDANYEFNAKTKKELKYDYRMHDPARSKTEEEYKAWMKEEGLLEWFEQAELIEKFFLDNSPEELTVDDEKVINNVEGGVTIADDSYSKLAKQAVQNAKDGVATTYVVGTGQQHGTDVYFATAQVNDKGEFTELVIDTIQGKHTEGVFSWNEKTKQELKYAYRMHGNFGLPEEEYKAFLKAEGKLEWFEQANIIAANVLEKGLASFVVNAEDKAEGEAYASVTVTVNHYKDVLVKLYNNFK